jgi:hypothetical protein
MRSERRQRAEVSRDAATARCGFKDDSAVGPNR